MSARFTKISGEQKIVVRNYGSLVVLQGLNYLLPLLIIPFLERKLGLEMFGLVMFAQAMMVFCTLVVDFGFNMTATREVALLKEKNADYSAIYFQVFWARLALLVLMFLILTFITFSFEKFSQHWQLYLLSYGVVVGQAIFPVWFFQGIEKMRFITIINVLAKVIFTVLLFIFISAPSDYLNVPLFNSIGFIVAGTVSFFLSLKYVSWQRPSYKSGKVFYKESLLMFVSNISSSLYTALNAFLLGIFGGDVLVGIYSSFEKLILAAKNMFVPIYQSIFPYMARKSTIEMNGFMKSLFIGIAILGILITAFFVIFAEWILGLLYNDPQILENAYLFKIMSSIAFFAGLNMLINVLYIPARKHFKQLMYIMLTAGIFNLVASLIVVPIFKIEGTVAMVVSTELLLLILALIYYGRELKNT
ncbi:MAG: oligosaccharide flippase family protein [Nonlabens sp.]|nr:oligosaccharide flippase family protein [Nonlabens sp.]